MSLRKLENHIGQLAITLSNRPRGSLPSNTEDPRKEGKKHCKVINLRSGKDVIVQYVCQKEELNQFQLKKKLKLKRSHKLLLSSPLV